MKLRATYHKLDFNPFVPLLENFVAQIRYAVTDEIPEDTDTSKLEELARGITPEGFRFVRLERID